MAFLVQRCGGAQLQEQAVKTGKEVINKAKTFVKEPVCAKKTIVHNPEKNPYAPLYRPNREILYKVDKFHFEPPVYYGKETPKVKELRFAAGAGGNDPNPDDFKNMLKLTDELNLENLGKKQPYINKQGDMAKYVSIENSNNLLN